MVWKDGFRKALTCVLLRELAKKEGTFRYKLNRDLKVKELTEPIQKTGIVR